MKRLARYRWWRPRILGLSVAWLAGGSGIGASAVPASRPAAEGPVNRPPIVEFVAPREAVYEQPAPVDFVARAEDYDGEIQLVEFGVDGRSLVRLPPRPGDAVYRYSWTNALAGTYVPWVRAVDREGAETRQELSSIQVALPNRVPSIRLLYPAPGQALVGPTNLVVRLEAVDPDGTIAEVRLWVDRTLAGRASGATADLVLPGLTDGEYCLTGEATDDRGGTARTEPVCVTVATAAGRYRMVDLGERSHPYDSMAASISSAGEVTGYGLAGGAADQAFVAGQHPVLGNRFTWLEVPEGPTPSAIVRTYGMAINGSGEVAGFATGLGDQDVAIRFTASGVEVLGTLDGAGGSAAAFGINDRGDIVGRNGADFGEGPRMYAFLVRGGKMRALPTAGVSRSEATAINERGWVTGTMQGMGGRQAFLYDANSEAAELTGLGLPGDGFFATEGRAINQRGQVAGVAWDGQGDLHPFVYGEGGWQALGTLGGGSGVAQGINSAGMVVGQSKSYRDENVACLWIDQVAYDLNRLLVGPAPLRLIEATGINDRGWIVAWGVRVVDGLEQRRAVLLVPSPEVVADAPRLSRQTGLFEQRVTFRVPGPTASPVARLLVGDVPAGVEFRQARSGVEGAYVEMPGSWQAGAEVTFVLEYYVGDRKSFVPPSILADFTGPAVPVEAADGAPVVTRVLRLREGAMLVEFSTLAGRKYAVETSDDAQTWFTVSKRVTGTGQRVQWVDQGPPQTPPLSKAQRFYRVLLLPAMGA